VILQTYLRVSKRPARARCLHLKHRRPYAHRAERITHSLKHMVRPAAHAALLIHVQSSPRGFTSQAHRSNNHTSANRHKHKQKKTKERLLCAKCRRGKNTKPKQTLYAIRHAKLPLPLPLPLPLLLLLPPCNFSPANQLTLRGTQNKTEQETDLPRVLFIQLIVCRSSFLGSG
jgi:hypothetical protein